MFSCVILRVPEPSGHYDLQIYALFPTCATALKMPQGNRIKLWLRQGFHEGNLVKSLHGIDVS